MRSTARYQRFRTYWFNRHPLCAGCEPKGRRRAGSQLDHVRPLRWFHVSEIEEACFDEGNVQTLCTECHGKKSAREQAVDRAVARGQV